MQNSVGVITNPNSKKNWRFPERRGAIQRAVGRFGVVKETKSLEELPRAVDELLDAGTKYWVCDGGDGTLHWVVNTLKDRLYERAGDDADLPVIVPTNGGTVDFIRPHPNAISTAAWLGWQDGAPRWGADLQAAVKRFWARSHLEFEVFADWTPHADCHVALDAATTDAAGLPAAKVRVGRHPRNLQVVERLTELGVAMLKAMGATDLRTRASAGPSTNLQAGGCRFGDDPTTSVLDRDCKAHGLDNLYIGDGSFLPSSGGTNPSLTIAAHGLRLAAGIADSHARAAAQATSGTPARRRPKPQPAEPAPTGRP